MHCSESRDYQKACVLHVGKFDQYQEISNVKIVIISEKTKDYVVAAAIQRKKDTEDVWNATISLTHDSHKQKKNYLTGECVQSVENTQL